MLQVDSTRKQDSEAKFVVRVAASQQEVEEAQRLRWSVFVAEQGARVAPSHSGLDVDRFDADCQHLLVRERATGLVVGTYRLLSWEQARRHGGFYTEQEFDLGGLAPWRAHIVEIGRSCVHPDYRRGGVIAMLWSGLADLVTEAGARFVVGCASISMRDGGQLAAQAYHHLARAHSAAPELRLRPHNPLPLQQFAVSASPCPLPPLIKGYIRAGARVAGEPAIDPDFGTADLPMLLDLKHVATRYARHFIGG
ncbi:MAG: GNAT family N-acyltransferase [Hyphomicrobiaceae bacterium]